MPETKSPKKRPTDTVSNAARVVRIATGEEADKISPKKRPTAEKKKPAAKR